MPNLISSDIYNETIHIIKGSKQLNPVFQGLKDWYLENAGYEIYNFYIYDNPYVKDKKSGKYQLMFLANGLLYVKDDQFIVGDIYNVSSVSGKKLNALNEDGFSYFHTLCKKYNIFSDINWVNNSISGYDFNPIWWCETVSKFAKKAVLTVRGNNSDINIDSIINSGFGSISIFFKTDNDLIKYRETGVCGSIKNEIMELFSAQKIHKNLKKYSENKDIVDFCSKETLDRDYNGNLYYYYK